MEASSYSPELTEDLIIQILFRCPVKSLLRFKLVSKTWHDFLKTPYFISMHHKFNLGTVSQLLMCSRDRSQIEDGDIRDNYVFSFYSNDKSARVLSPELPIITDSNITIYVVRGSCNGIVCYYDQFSSIYLCNPATREFKRLSPTSFQQVADQKLYLSGVAFGYDSTNIYDFKVLRLFSALTKKRRPKPSNKGLRAEMFTLSSNSWKQLHWGLDDSLFLHHKGYFCANSFHFIADRHKTPVNTIVCCDIRTERFKTMELPSIVNQQGLLTCLMVFKEFLSSVCALPHLTHCKEKLLEVWIMKDYGVVESWTKLYTIGPPWGYVVPQCFWIEDDALLLLQWDTFKLVSCHLNTLQCEDAKIDGHQAFCQLVVYKETLVSIM